MRIGILASHPIQYDAPLYRALAERAEVMVYYAHRQDAEGQAAAGFGVEFEWDRDLLDSYPYRFLTNESATPSTDTFFGCDTPEISGHVAGDGFDAFVLNGWYLKSHWQAVRACRKQNIPVLVRGDSHLRTPRSKVTQAVKEIGYRIFLRAFDGFLYVGQRNREYLEHYGVPQRKLFFCPRFVDNDWFRTRAAEAAAEVAPLRRRMLREAGASDADTEKTTVLLFVGKFTEEKRPQDLLHAADQLHKTRCDVAITYVGSGPLGGMLRREAKIASVPVHFAGFKNQSKLPLYYAAADLLVLPSKSETWGLVVNEAMACGLPAVVSDAVGCAPDLVEPGTTGERFPVGDVDALAESVDAMLGCLGDDHLRRAVAETMQTYSLDTAVDGIVGAARTLSRSPGVPAPSHS